MRLYIFITIVSAIFYLTSCSERPNNVDVTDKMPSIYPDYIGVTIPVGIAPLNFNIDSVDRVEVVVKGSEEGVITTNGEWAEFDIDEWNDIVSKNVGGELSFQTTVKRNGKWVQYAPFSVFISADSLSDFGVVYRKIIPGYETFSHIGIYQRDIHSFKEYPIVESTAAPGECMNCHAFKGTDPSLFQLHFRGMHGATLIQKDGVRRWLNTKTDSTIANCMYPYWHPSGNYCAYSLNLVHQRFFTCGKDYIDVFDRASDAVILDVRNNELILSDIFRTADLETFPVFSADGKTIYYCTSKYYENAEDYEKLRYDLCSVSFDPQIGRIGEVPDTLIKASVDSMSISFPTPSHDGRFLLYCYSNHGVFPINSRDADLWLYDIATGERYPLDAANSNESESYHSWSTNSRWIVFCSRRDDGLHSRLFIAHVDESGKASKPFVLPQRNPKEYYSRSHYAYNVPEFVCRKVEYDAQAAFSELFYDEREGVVPVRKQNKE